ALVLGSIMASATRMAILDSRTSRWTLTTTERSGRKPEMSLIRCTACWPGFAIIAGLGATAWFVAGEVGMRPSLAADRIAQADAPASTTTAAADTPRNGQRVKGKLVKSYSTRFPLNEAPISEGGKWINGAKDGIDWYDVITRNGVAFGAVTEGEYTD